MSHGTSRTGIAAWKKEAEMHRYTFERSLPSGRVTWGYSIDAGKNENRKRKQIFKSGFEWKGDADDALRQKVHEKDAGALVKLRPTHSSRSCKSGSGSTRSAMAQPIRVAPTQKSSRHDRDSTILRRKRGMEGNPLRSPSRSARERKICRGSAHDSGVGPNIQRVFSDVPISG